MASLASINIRFTADLRQFSTQMQSANRDIAKLGTSLSNVGNTLSLGITLPLLAFGAAAVKVYGDIQALNLGLESVMGSADAAGEEFNKLREVAKLPGLGLEEAIRGSVNLQAAGFSAAQARDTLLSFGNALATVGKGKNELNLVILALTQLQNKSGGYAQDLRQLTEQLPQLRGALKNAFGTSNSEEIQALGYSGKQLVSTLTAEFGKLPKVSGGIKNAFENVGDSVKLSLAKVGEAIDRNLDVEGKLNAIGDKLGELADAFSNLAPATQSTILVVAGLAAAIGPLLLGIGGLVTIYPLVVAGFVAIKTAFLAFGAAVVANPIGAVLTVVGLLAVSLIALRTNLLSAGSAFKKFGNDAAVTAEINAQASSEYAKSSADLRAKIEPLIATIKSSNLTLKDRKAAYEKLISIAPEFTGTLDAEFRATDKLQDAYDKLLLKMREKMQFAAMQKVFQARYDDEAKAIERVVSAESKLNEERRKKEIRDKAIKQAGTARGTGFINDEYVDALLEYEQAQADYITTQQNLKVIEQFREKQIAALTAEQKQYNQGSKEWLDVQTKINALLGLTADAANDASDALGGLNVVKFKAGTIAFYQEQITALKKLQNEVSTTSGSWLKYGDRIDAIQKKIDSIEGKGPVKIKKPELPAFEADADLPSPSFSLEELGNQLSYFTQLREQYSRNSKEFEFYSQQINNTEIKIKAINGEEAIDSVKAIVNTLEADMQRLQEIGQVVGDAVGGAFADLSSQVVNSLGLADTGFQGFVKGLMQTVTKLIAMMLAQSISQSIAGATASGTATGPAAVFATPAFIATAVGGVLAAFAAIPKFATGGIVGGHSFFGDKILARLNSSELVLNSDQQRKLHGMITPAGSNVNVNLEGTTRISGSDLEVILKRIDQRNNRTR